MESRHPRPAGSVDCAQGSSRDARPSTGDSSRIMVKLPSDGLTLLTIVQSTRLALESRPEGLGNSRGRSNLPPPSGSNYRHVTAPRKARGHLLPLVAAVTFAFYNPIVRNQFVDFDDLSYM